MKNQKLLALHKIRQLNTPYKVKHDTQNNQSNMADKPCCQYPSLYKCFWWQILSISAAPLLVHLA